MNFRLRRPWAALLAWGCCCWAVLLGKPLFAQEGEVSLDVDSTQIGLYGTVRPGSWTPMQVTLTNHASKPLTVYVQVLVPDMDRDTGQWRRKVTLTPQRQQKLWLYARAPMLTNETSFWRFQLVDEATGQVRVVKEVKLRDNVVYGEMRITPETQILGIVGQSMMGLDAYQREYTQHEAIRILRGLEPETLPDRWHGLSMLQTLVWTPEVDPDATSISPEFHKALHTWVKRGGHLVIVQPTSGELWSASPLADLLPPVSAQTVTGVTRLPPWLGNASGLTVTPIDIQVFELTDPKVSVLLRERPGNDGRPVVVAHAYGFGRVTLIGVDLADKRLTQMGLPRGPDLWNTVMGWTSPAWSRAVIDGLVNEKNPKKMIDLGWQREAPALDYFLVGQARMQETAVPAVLAAVVLFIIYWLAAGPGSYFALKVRGMVRLSWLAFATIVMLFSVLSWGGALLMRPQARSLRHFSFLDVDVASHSGRVTSWATILVPKHGDVDVVIAPQQTEANVNLLSSAGIEGEDEEGARFLDPRVYPLEASAPSKASFPFRSTAKQIELQYVGDYLQRDGTDDPIWGLPSGDVRLGNDGWPVGTLKHQLPGSLENVEIVFSDGRIGETQLWFLTEAWQRGQPLNIGTRPPSPQRLRSGLPLSHTGWVGRLPALFGKRSNVSGMTIPEIVEGITFFGALPPPHWSEPADGQEWAGKPIHWRRPNTMALDLTPQLALPRLLIIGHMPNTPLPAPMTVDDRVLPGAGWTVVRAIFPVNVSAFPAKTTGPESSSEGAGG